VVFDRIGVNEARVQPRHLLTFSLQSLLNKTRLCMAIKPSAFVQRDFGGLGQNAMPGSLLQESYLGSLRLTLLAIEYIEYLRLTLLAIE
jgi:hypothetical protein